MTDQCQDVLTEALERISPPDREAMRLARARLDSLIKPAGSLGELETIAARIAGITGSIHNHVDKKVHFLFGADNGVYVEGVSGTPQHFTGLLMKLYADRRGCCIDTFCKKAEVELRLFDLGIKGLGPYPGIDSSHKYMPRGTGNIVRENAMSGETARAAVAYGITLVKEAAENGYRIIGTGEVGMGNTTTAAACIMAALGTTDTDLIGRGGGLTDEAFARKKAVITRALAFHHLEEGDAPPLRILSCVGGLDIAAMTGVFLGAAAYRVPAIVDGLIAVSAALLAERSAPGVSAFLFGSHCSTEPAFMAAARELGLAPLLNLHLRVGEGTGCPLAMQVIEDALYAMNHMASFKEEAVEDEYREGLRF